MRRKRFVCPECEQKTGVPIVYGFPANSLIRQAKRNEVVLGGCFVAIDAPNRHCRNCQHQWIDDEKSV